MSPGRVTVTGPEDRGRGAEAAAGFRARGFVALLEVVRGAVAFGFTLGAFAFALAFAGVCLADFAGAFGGVRAFEAEAGLPCADLAAAGLTGAFLTGAAFLAGDDLAGDDLAGAVLLTGGLTGWACAASGPSASRRARARPRILSMRSNSIRPLPYSGASPDWQSPEATHSPGRAGRRPALPGSGTGA